MAAWKRLAIPLDRVYQPNELSGMVFDAYDDDGIYFLSIGDAFMAPAASAASTATARTAWPILAAAANTTLRPD
jgi:hypothetical protein